MVQPKYSPEEALQKIKLSMSYDMSKTLNENAKEIGVILNEQSSGGVGASTAAQIARNIYNETVGDVQTKDLDDILSILNNNVFGKLYEDGQCLLEKVLTYYSQITRPSGLDAALTLTLPFNLTGDNLKKSLIDRLTSSSEGQELEFEEVKTKLINTINKELNGFCKNKKTIVKDDSKRQNSINKIYCSVVNGIIKLPESKVNNKTWSSFARFYEVTPEELAIAKKSCGSNADDGKTNRYRNCTGTYTKGCKSEAIKPVQACLGLVADGKFWNKTQAALETKGFPNGFTDADIPKICGEKSESSPTPGEETIDDVNNG
jgi:hypothetical protein